MLGAGLPSVPFDLHMVGQARWRFRRVVAIDVRFKPWMQCRIGMGPHQHGSNDGYAWYYGVQEARLFIDPDKAVPLYILAYTIEGNSKYDPKTGTIWEFNPKFFPVDGGLAPRSIAWYSLDRYRGWLRDRLEFQLVNGTWIFKRGQMRSGCYISKNPDRHGLERLNETVLTENFELVNFQSLPASTNAPDLPAPKLDRAASDGGS